MLTVAGAVFGPLHNLVSLCIDTWRSAEVISDMTRLPIETVWFVLFDLKRIGILEERVLNGDEYQLKWNRSQHFFDANGKAKPTFQKLRPK